MKTKQGRRLRLFPIILAVGVSLAVAACGSSSGGSKTTTASASSTRAKLVACLEKHGVTLPDRRPGSGRSGGGFFGGGAPPGGTGTGAAPSGTPPNGGSFPGAGGFPGGGGFFGRSSKFRTAFKACGGSFRRFRPGARPGAARRGFSAATLDKFVTCVRKHGYDLPKPNTSGSGPIFPRSIEANKKFETAARSCAGDLRPSTPSSGTNATTSS